jgi:hypothetical protein
MLTFPPAVSVRVRLVRSIRYHRVRASHNEVGTDWTDETESNGRFAATHSSQAQAWKAVGTRMPRMPRIQPCARTAAIRRPNWQGGTSSTNTVSDVNGLAEPFRLMYLASAAAAVRVDRVIPHPSACLVAVATSSPSTPACTLLITGIVLRSNIVDDEAPPG